MTSPRIRFKPWEIRLASVAMLCGIGAGILFYSDFTVTRFAILDAQPLPVRIGLITETTGRLKRTAATSEVYFREAAEHHPLQEGDALLTSVAGSAMIQLQGDRVKMGPATLARFSLDRARSRIDLVSGELTVEARQGPIMLIHRGRRYIVPQGVRQDFVVPSESLDSPATETGLRIEPAKPLEA